MIDKCPKCSAKMLKQGNINSGNSKYALWKCESCKLEKMECIGVNS